MAQPQQQQSDNSLAALWIMVLILVVLGLIWHFFKAEIIAFVLTIKRYELYAIQVFTHRYDDWVQWLEHVQRPDMTFENLSSLCVKVGSVLRYPVAGILTVLGAFLLMGSNSLRFRKTYSMKKLVETEHKNWPQITPVTSVNLIKEDLDTGPWAMAVPPMDFAKKHDLLKVTQPKKIAGDMLSHQVKPEVSIVRGRGRSVFALQLGKLWKGFEELTPVERVLFAIFAAKGCGKDSLARKLLDQVSRSTESGRLDFSGARRLAAKFFADKRVQDIVSRHAYVLTMLSSMLEFARTDGVLASADFLWLKPVDRRLWYMMNSVGRQTACPEIAGAYAHWIAERELKRPLFVPMIDSAITGLERAVKEIIYKPDEDGEDG